MNDEFIEKLNEELIRQLEEISKLEPETEAYTNAVTNFVKMCNIAMENNKIDSETEIKLKQVEGNLSIEDEKMNNEFKRKDQARKDKIIEIVAAALTTAFTIIVPNNFKLRCFKDFLKFEETGSASSLLTRGLINSLFRSK